MATQKQFKRVDVLGMDMAVVSSSGCICAAVNRDGRIYAYMDNPTVDRENGVWLSAKPSMFLGFIHNMKPGKWLKSLSAIY